jgi:hypothetical protein
MRTVFADTHYFIAQFNSNDISFEIAAAFPDSRAKSAHAEVPSQLG